MNGIEPVFQFTIYDHPRDYPDKFVVRAFAIFPGEVLASGECILCDTLEEAREKIPPGLICLPRAEGDDPVIVEVWI